MNINLLTRLMALAIGFGMMLDGVINSVGLVLRYGLDSSLSIPQTLLGLAPTLLACVFAIIIYRFAKRIEHPEYNQLSTNILYAGVKLFGIYFLVKGIPSLISGIGLAMSSVFSDAIPERILQILVVGFTYTIVGLALLIRTNWLLHVITNDRGLNNQHE